MLHFFGVCCFRLHRGLSRFCGASSTFSNLWMWVLKKQPGMRCFCTWSFYAAIWGVWSLRELDLKLRAQCNFEFGVWRLGQGLLCWLHHRCLKVSLGTVKWNRSSYGTDLEPCWPYDMGFSIGQKVGAAVSPRHVAQSIMWGGKPQPLPNKGHYRG